MLAQQVTVGIDKAKKRRGHKFYYVSLRANGLQTIDDRGQDRFFFSTKNEAIQYAINLNNEQQTGGIFKKHPEKSVGVAIELMEKRTNQRYEDGVITESQRYQLIKNSYDWAGLNTKAMGKKSLADILCMDVTEEMVEDMLHLFKLADETKAQKLNALKQVFDCAIRARFCKENVARKVKFEKKKYAGEKSAEQFLLEKIVKEDIQDLIKISSNYPGRDGLLIEFAIMTGLRWGEQAALKWKNIDFKRKVVLVRLAVRKQRDGSTTADIPKTTKQGKRSKARRSVFLTPDLLVKLQKWKLQTKYSGPDDYVFATSTGTREQSSHNWRNRVLKPTCKIVGIELRWHDLRHVFASICLSIYGNDLPRIADLMGHENIDTTRNNYGHWIDNRERDEMDANDFENAIYG